MSDNHVDLPSRASDVRSSPRSRRELPRSHEAHVVVATQNLPRMSGAIHALIQAGYLVTAYASPTRLLPRLHRMTSHPVSLLVIDGGLAPAIARAAAIAARATYAHLPIILLVTAQAARCTALMPAGVTVLHLPLSEPSLITAAAALACRHAWRHPLAEAADRRLADGAPTV